MPKQNVKVELFYDGVWNDATAAGEVFTAPIKIVRGQGDESAALRPSAIDVQLDNRTDKYRTSNPESPLYGKAGRNTPVRVSVGSSVRGIGEASSLAPDETRDFRPSPLRGKAWVDVEAGGLLQRINQWTQLQRSPFYTFNVGLAGLAGYFSLEDARGSTKAASAVDGAFNSRLYGVSFDSQRRPPGSAPLADIDAQTSASGVFRFTGGSAGDNVGWQFSVVQYISALDALTEPLNVTTRDGMTATLSLVDSTNDATIVVTDAGGATLINTTVNYGSYQWEGRWLMIGFDVTVSGGTVTVQALWRAIDENFWTTFSGTYAGITSSLDRCHISGIPGFTVGHLTATNGRVDLLTSNERWDALLGHAGERAAIRFGRLLDEALGPGHYYVSAGFASSAPMGPQPVATLPDLIKECVLTEDAVVSDHRVDLRLLFTCRVDRYNQTAVTLAPADFPSLPREITDDQGIHNIITVSQRDGEDVTVSDDTGPLGTLPPPDGAGEYRQSVDVNLDDPSKADLLQQANWWLYRGTVDVPRYPQVAVQLAALSPTRVAAIEALNIGNVIEIVGMREFTVRLQVLGYTETISTHDRWIVFTCRPDQQFDIGHYFGTIDKRRDSKSTTLKTTVNATATSLTFRTVNPGDLWAVGSNPAGLYDVLCAGELVRVATMGAATLVSGAYDQVATVYRSANNVVKSLQAGEPIHVANKVRYAL